MNMKESIILFGLLFSLFCFSSGVLGQEFGLDRCVIEEVVVFGHPSLLIEFETPVSEDVVPELFVLRCSFSIDGIPNENFQKFILDVIPWSEELSENEARTSICGSYWLSDGENSCLDLTRSAQCSEGILSVRCLLTPLTIPSQIEALSISAQKGLSDGGVTLIMPPAFTDFSESNYYGEIAVGNNLKPSISVTAESTDVALVLYPNPFNAKLFFKFSAPAGQLVMGRLDIYDLRGRRLVSDKIFFDGELVYSWNGQTDSGTVVPSGNYFVSFTNKGNGEKITLPVLLIK